MPLTLERRSKRLTVVPKPPADRRGRSEPVVACADGIVTEATTDYTGMNKVTLDREQFIHRSAVRVAANQHHVAPSVNVCARRTAQQQTDPLAVSR